MTATEPIPEPVDTGLGVQVTSARPGVAPVAFVAYVQYVDDDGEVRIERITSTGLSDERAARIEAR